jgi:hypothetical protein
MTMGFVSPLKTVTSSKPEGTTLAAADEGAGGGADAGPRSANTPAMIKTRIDLPQKPTRWTRLGTSW